MRRWSLLRCVALSLLITAICACDVGRSSDTPLPTVASRSAAAGDTGTGAQPIAQPVLIVCLGDSLTAGLGLSEEQAFPALVEQALRNQSLAVRVINAGVSGDTTAGGVRRVDWLLKQHPDILVIGLGANDGLRGQPLDGIAENLRTIIDKAQAAGAKVLLLGMRIPTNYGTAYADGFRAIYPRLAKQMSVALVPFLLEGVALDPTLNQADQIHPNAEGHKIVARTVLSQLAPLVREHGHP